MAESNQQPPQSRWRLTQSDKRYLCMRFRQDLLTFLEALKTWRQRTDGPSRTELEELAAECDAAGRELDIAAANCRAVAATLRAYASGDTKSSASADAGIRLKQALGERILLTHTTIEQLAGRTLTLEYIDGANAIVQVDGDYWGTPLDRILVLPQDQHQDDEAGTGENEPSPAFRFRLRGGEISNVIQFLTMTTRTGLLQVAFTQQHAEGKVMFADGRVLNATLDGHQGIEAVARMMNLDSAEATFVDNAAVGGTAIQPRLSTEQLLIEAAVKADEMREN